MWEKRTNSSHMLWMYIRTAMNIRFEILKLTRSCCMLHTQLVCVIEAYPVLRAFSHRNGVKRHSAVHISKSQTLFRLTGRPPPRWLGAGLMPMTWTITIAIPPIKSDATRLDSICSDMRCQSQLYSNSLRFIANDVFLSVHGLLFVELNCI